MNPQTHRHLIEGLVGDANLDLWHNSPWFHAQIVGLAQLLPFMVDGIAAEARRLQERDHDHMQRLMTEPVRVRLPYPWAEEDEEERHG